MRIYTLPKVAVQVSGTFRNVPGDTMRPSSRRATRIWPPTRPSVVRWRAARPTSPSTSWTTNELYLDRRNELDMRFGKVLRFGRARSQSQRRHVQRHQQQRAHHRESGLRGLLSTHVDSQRPDLQVQRSVRLLVLHSANANETTKGGRALRPVPLLSFLPVGRA